MLGKIFFSFFFLCTRGLVADVQPRRKETGMGRGKTDGKVVTPPPTTTTTTTTCLFLYSFFASLYFPSFYFPSLYFPSFYFPLSSAPSACSSSLYLPPSPPQRHVKSYILVWILRQTEKEISTLTHILLWKKEREREGDRDTQRDREGGRDAVS